jgi:SAM-dependent methyltransferase
MDVVEYNRNAWNRQVEKGNRWTVGASPEEIAAARGGEVTIYLTPAKPVPQEWMQPLAGADVLGLASGGGQQGPILAAAGANVTIFDNSPRQLARDEEVAAREGLAVRTVQGDMADLSVFPDASFDLIVHPISNAFSPVVLPVWREAFRVLRSGGSLLAGFVNPAIYLFDLPKADNEGVLEVKYTLPFREVDTLSEAQLVKLAGEGWPLEFSHSLEEQIGGQCAAGFHLLALFEDRYPPEEDILARYMPTFVATRAWKPARS